MDYLNGILEEIKKKNLDVDIEKIKLAFSFAEEAHVGQFRQSGDNYILHPVQVAKIIIDMGMDTDSIIAGILHDIVEDTFITIADIKYNFGESVANLVDGVTKLKKLPNGTKQQDESIRKMMLAMSKDIRVIIIKLADRLHNMKTLNFVPEEKQLRVSKETLAIYAPLAHRLGMAKIKSELEDLCFMYIYPEKYVEVRDFVNSKKEERDEYIKDVENIISGLLKKAEIEGNIKGRFKHYYSIYKKVYEKHRSYDDLYDLMGIRIIVKDVTTCYHTLGVIHEQFSPVPGRFKDYIAVPKSNNYQSIHTTIVGPEGKFVEIQIRTEEMDRIAEEGVAAHWSYKEKVKVGKKDKVYSWLRDIIELNKEADSAKDFVTSITGDIIEETIFAFSPRGDILELKTGATPIDFAFAIHSEVGCKCIGAKVNGDIVPLDYKLKSGDRVEIITSKSAKGPGNDWLDIVVTQGAKSKIRKWLKEKKWEENIRLGKDSLEKEIEKLTIPMTLKDLEESPVIKKHMEKHHIPTLDEFYFIMGEKRSKVEIIVDKLRDYQESIREKDIPQKTVIAPTQKSSRKKNDYGIIVEGIDNTLIRFAKCCTPLPGDEIGGYITKLTGIAIHRKDCKNFQNMIEHEPERQINVKWDLDVVNKKLNKYQFKFSIIAEDNKSLVMEIVALIANHKIFLTDINSNTITKNGKKYLKIKVAVEISNKRDYSLLIENIKKIKYVIEIER
ncbi:MULTISPECIES: RelA/SpoT family protein [Fusobacterium]|uniref:RelA/SpoT family protein n=1 Tax=Fusobacterium TaxID=848 RepID=UPI001F3A836A|nr:MULTISPECIES: bifunctional (p)ppGpp synthetase/guanosine-3',5'-bis(diphosphate) 3'-pyrophosphohydrolase [Fusobacterium]MCF2611950.1 bifunctional (p)ppGpp synthetase/guanosine-3',5'-bis(diphosphate) 3'-pyrophosphohydrolase [Fusobacterium perfoetens]MDY2981091.1 bifunctional (p)ppGpp synthetase/guanosine-3',5'-bis(diphosphate) 3'-pyrophosphohydrolase [Fusobacterium sp.]